LIVDFVVDEADAMKIRKMIKKFFHATKSIGGSQGGSVD